MIENKEQNAPLYREAARKLEGVYSHDSRSEIPVLGSHFIAGDKLSTYLQMAIQGQSQLSEIGQDKLEELRKRTGNSGSTPIYPKSAGYDLSDASTQTVNKNEIAKAIQILYTLDSVTKLKSQSGLVNLLN